MTLMLPPAPLIADPVLNVIIPLLPLLELPEVNESEPETPLVPASAVLMLNTPLEFARP
jgi:hypothetical protein